MDFQRYTLSPIGVVNDVSPYLVPEDKWTNVLNYRFNDGVAEKIEGDDVIHTGTAETEHIIFNGDHDNPIWIFAGSTFGTIKGTDFVTNKNLEVVPLPTVGGSFDSCLFNQNVVLNNTIDAPKYWDGDYATPTGFLPVPSFPASTTCKAIRPYRSFLVAMNITDTTATPNAQPTRLIWSNSSDSGAMPADWNIADPSSLAGDAYLTDSRGEVIDGLALRDLFVIYKKHSTYIMRLIGGQSVMRLDKIQFNSGILTKNCVTEFEGKHFVVAENDIIVFDGQHIKSIADNVVRKQIFDNINVASVSKCHVAQYAARNEIWFCYPELTETVVTRAAIWNWIDNTWTFRELVSTDYVAAGFLISRGTDTVFNADGLMIGTTDAVGQFRGVGEGTDFKVLTMTTLLQKDSMDFGDTNKIKFVKSVMLNWDDPTPGRTAIVTIGTQMWPDDAITWGTGKIAVASATTELFFNQKGRYISIKIETTDAASEGVQRGFSVDFKYVGEY